MSHKKTNPADRLIVALDHTDIQSAKMLMDRLSGGIQLYKIGSALFTRYGPSAIEAVHQRGAFQVLDPLIRQLRSSGIRYRPFPR